MAAKVGKPAPAWKGKAVVEGEFKMISSDDFKVLASCVLSSAFSKAHSSDTRDDITK